ncbi:MAG: ribonuclease P protein component [Candidatus Uhrbacteria bacterium]
MLSQEHRLRKAKEVEVVFTTGRSVFDPVCGFKFLKNNLSDSRFAVLVGNKISKSAVVRNRLRRQIREIIRLHLEKIRPGLDVIFIVRAEAKGKKYQDLERVIIGGLKRARLM